MLHLYYTKTPDKIEVSNPIMECRYGRFYDYIVDDFCKRFIKDIDKTDVISKFELHSEVLDDIYPTMLSGGVHCLLVLYGTEKSNNIFMRVSHFGHNCFPWLYELGKTKEIHLYMDYPILWKGKDVDSEFIVKVEDTGRIIRKYIDYLYLYNEFNDMDDDSPECRFSSDEEMFEYYGVWPDEEEYGRFQELLRREGFISD